MKNIILFALVLIFSFVTVQSFQAQTYDVMEETQNSNEYQAPADKGNNEEIVPVEETSSDVKPLLPEDPEEKASSNVEAVTATKVEDPEDKSVEEFDQQDEDNDEDYDNEDSSFDSQKLPGFNCTLSRFSKRSMTCKKLFGDANGADVRPVSRAKRAIKRFVRCRAVYRYRKNLGERRSVNYVVSVCRKSVGALLYMKSVIVQEYCEKKPDNCERKDDGYNYVRRSKNVAEDFYLNYAFKIDLLAKLEEVHDKLRKALVITQDLPKFTCVKRTVGRVTKVERELCTKRFGYLGADLFCKKFTSGQFTRPNNTNWVFYVSSYCVPKVQRTALRKAVRDMKRTVVNQYCEKHPSQCVRRRRVNRYVRRANTLRDYQTFILTAEPAYNVTQAVRNIRRKYKFGGRWRESNRFKLKKYKKVKITFPITVNGKQVLVTRELRVDPASKEYFLVPSSTSEGRNQDEIIQTQLNGNTTTASFVTAEVAKNSGSLKVVSIAVLAISALLFLF